MLFHAPGFIFLYLPLVLAVFFALGRISRPAAAAWLAAASVGFYAWWSVDYLWLLGCSILFNFVVGGLIVRAVAGAPARAGLLLAVGVAGNLLLLGYYKYANFFLATAAGITGRDYGALEVILPLGISFFTFTQIAFLVDARRGLAREYNFAHYLLFVTYFPHLIAGPILHHAEMMPQFARPETYSPRGELLSAGLAMFLLGLFKKIVIADGIAHYVGPVFDAPGKGIALSAAEAWGGALAYTMQLYFDFSGYSDMAIGLSLMLGIRLPLNFNSPYKAASIVEFWQRWHMTLSRFLREYLYIPLGGNRRGPARRYVNLMATMLLGGLWHGAAWTFVAWGALHGAYLCVNHAWRAATAGRAWTATRAYACACVLVTFAAVVVAWVVFRADSMPHAAEIVRALFGANGALAGASGARDAVIGTGVTGWLLVCLFLVWVMPNSQQVVLGIERWEGRLSRWLAWRPDLAWTAALALVALVALSRLHTQSEFLYFQF
ncbi:MAG: MBOAT family protein [Burkholderiales bacterium]|nr:MBOAT family protein [Burkholderiales bacterium]